MMNARTHIESIQMLDELSAIMPILSGYLSNLILPLFFYSPFVFVSWVSYYFYIIFKYLLGICSSFVFFFWSKLRRWILFWSSKLLESTLWMILQRVHRNLAFASAPYNAIFSNYVLWTRFAYDANGCVLQILFVFLFALVFSFNFICP